ncbi:MAG: hypothetical protein AB7S65_00015 [Sulfuricurvum sp.]
MRISHTCRVKVNELAQWNRYEDIYWCFIQIKSDDSRKFDGYERLRDVLDEIIVEDSKNIYNHELLKIKAYVEHNKRAEVPYESNDMWSVSLGHGQMHDVTVQLLVDNEGLGEYELEEFKESLYSTFHDEVHSLYEEIERNVDYDARKEHEFYNGR